MTVGIVKGQAIRLSVVDTERCVVCFFARGIYNPDIVSEALQVAGFDLTTEDLHGIGEEIHREKYRFKFREGFSLDNVRLPKRIFETASPVGKLDEEYIRNAVEYVKKTSRKATDAPKE